MKVLQICLKPPCPEVDGGCKAMHALSKGFLENNVELKILSISTQKHPFLKEKLSENYIKKTKIEHVFIDTKVKPVDALMNLVSSKSYNIERFYNKNFERLIVKTITETDFDIVLLESLYVSKYVEAIRKISQAKIIYRAHNLESEIWERAAFEEKGVKKAYLKSLAKKLAVYEKRTINVFDGVASITQKDKNKLEAIGCKVPIEVSPFGIDIDEYSFSEVVSGKKVFHIGSMDWKPNQKAIKWLLEKVWVRVIEELPSAQLNLAGRNMPKWLQSDKKANVTVLGEVDSAIDFINNNNIMVVPLVAGSGMRIKIIEAMALGKLVIATSIAAEGIAYTFDKNIVIANSVSEMSKAIIYYSENEVEQVSIGKSARKLIESNYDNKVIVANLLAFFKKI